MGSPEGWGGMTTKARSTSVRLTEGFWLAETACSQAVWEAVMQEAEP